MNTNYSNFNYADTPAYIGPKIDFKQSTLIANCLDMAYVAATAEDAFVLPQPIKTCRYINNTAKRLQYNEKFNMDKQFTEEHFKTNLEINKKIDMKIASRKTLFDSIRKVYPTFGRNMNFKISQEDFEIYSKMKRIFKKCIGTSISYSDEISSEEILMQYNDTISKVIDTREFSHACQIEDNFVLSELNIFLEKFQELSDKQKQYFYNTQITKLDGTQVNILDFANIIKNERQLRLEKYSEIEKLYKKLDNHSFIKLNVNEKNNRELYR